MQTAHKIMLIIGIVVMCIGSALVTIAALWGKRRRRGKRRNDGGMKR